MPKVIPLRWLVYIFLLALVHSYLREHTNLIMSYSLAFRPPVWLDRYLLLAKAFIVALPQVLSIL